MNDQSNNLKNIALEMILQKINENINEILDKKLILNFDKKLSDLEIDEFDMTEIVMSLEEWLEIPINDQFLSSQMSITDFAAEVYRQIKSYSQELS